jgi:hypothetical protein
VSVIQWLDNLRYGSDTLGYDATLLTLLACNWKFGINGATTVQHTPRVFRGLSAEDPGALRPLSATSTPRLRRGPCSYPILSCLLCLAYSLFPLWPSSLSFPDTCPCSWTDTYPIHPRFAQFTPNTLATTGPSNLAS